MRGVGPVIVALAAACACNALTGVGDLDPSLASDACGSGDCTDGGSGGGDGGDLDGNLVSDVTKDADDDTPGGYLDATFGTKGITKTNLLPEALSVAVDSIGRIYVLGVAAAHLSIVRFTIDGKVDTTFGSNGILGVPMGSGSGGTLPNIGITDPLAGIAIDSLDRIVVGGTSQETIQTSDGDGGVITSYQRYLYAARVKDGALDPAFGMGGKFRPSPPVNGEGARAVAIGSGDSVVLVGSGPSGTFTAWHLGADGTTDMTFGNAGRAVIAVPSASNAVGVAVGSKSIFAVGGSNGDFAIGGLSDVGAPLAGFGGDGGVAIVAPGPSDDEARAASVLSDGRIMVGGSKSVAGVRSPVFSVARLATNGTVDTTFGMGGFVTLGFDIGGTWKDVDEELHGLVVDSRGRVVVAGFVLEKPQTGPGFYRTVLARLKSDGSLDPLFGAGGKLSFTDSNERLRASALARAANGSLVVAGNVDGATEIFVARVTP